MTLTLNRGPLSGRPPEAVNYTIDGPEHRLLLSDFPRRVRAIFAGTEIIDSRRAKQLHETAYLPQLYVPEDDVRMDLLEPTDHRTRCPFKGDASYWSIRVDGRVADNAVWAYRDPTERASWLAGYYALQFDAMDSWFDEDEEIEGHLRDPYHRVDVRQSSRHVRVVADNVPVAETRRPMLLSETGLRNRYYIPPEDVREDLLHTSSTRTVCPYKGTATYHTLRIEDQVWEDTAWSYLDPFENALKVRGHLCFSGPGIEIEIDGSRVE
ncbi:DUF427 domain-containing protein [Actinobacteria bacterium YIM 96077]|uniref:DUF427 domain-containing protein n=1 Tax=Phytoactinopolyspora halophila TaxID=1981511 RepID=A0A329QTM0_9ACTN|nr:DUF427 domain-containing protein [Phytoactinopolyspora halophila]AYY14556.1 DUF427 domain-containing protein [Actinobacteria bacterium YIM 96077]RAW14068.1 hypothetical protein DPM12_11625 [Phytoactinopolyspora halophila]